MECNPGFFLQNGTCHSYTCSVGQGKMCKDRVGKQRWCRTTKSSETRKVSLPEKNGKTTFRVKHEFDIHPNHQMRTAQLS